MRVLFSPQVRPNETIEYEFNNDIVKATHKIERTVEVVSEETGGTESQTEIESTSDTFDFSGFGDGVLKVTDDDSGETIIETDMENPIRSAERIDGVLYVTLMNYISLDATHEECFPEWIDHTDYIAPEESGGDDSEQLGMEE